jgi:hypothetical protein
VVFDYMPLQPVPPKKRSCTVGTLEGHLPSVQRNVFHHVGGFVRAVAAELAKQQGPIGPQRETLPDALDASAPQLGSLLKIQKTWIKKKKNSDVRILMSFISMLSFTARKMPSFFRRGSDQLEHTT